MRNTGVFECATASAGDANSMFNPNFARTYQKPTSTVGQKKVRPGTGMKGTAKSRVCNLAERSKRNVANGDSATMAQ